MLFVVNIKIREVFMLDILIKNIGSLATAEGNTPLSGK